MLHLYTFVLLCFHHGVCSASGRSQYIIGGEEAEPHTYPWQLALYRWNADFWMYRCGAVLIHPRFALTAAHCVDRYGTFHLLAGAHNVTAGDYEVEIVVQEVFDHPGYDMTDPGQRDDIAVLEFTEAVNFTDRVQPILMAESGSDFAGNEDCWIAGWGIIDLDTDDRLSPNNVLHDLNIPVLTNEECEDWWREFGDFHQVYPTHICLGDRENRDIGSCSGDSGGGVYCPTDEGELVVAGLTSWGSAQCGDAPSVYTRVSEYLDWIESHIPE